MNWPAISGNAFATLGCIVSILAYYDAPADIIELYPVWAWISVAIFNTLLGFAFGYFVVKLLSGERKKWL